MTEDKSLCYDYQSCHTNFIVHIVDGFLSKVVETISIQLSPDITLKFVFHIPKFECNLISTSKLTHDHNCFTKFLPNVCFSRVRRRGLTVLRCAMDFLFKTLQPREALVVNSDFLKSKFVISVLSMSLI